jgi:hypothetical protein
VRYAISDIEAWLETRLHLNGCANDRPVRGWGFAGDARGNGPVYAKLGAGPRVVRRYAIGEVEGVAHLAAAPAHARPRADGQTLGEPVQASDCELGGPRALVRSSVPGLEAWIETHLLSDSSDAARALTA